MVKKTETFYVISRLRGMDAQPEFVSNYSLRAAAFTDNMRGAMKFITEQGASFISKQIKGCNVSRVAATYEVTPCSSK